MEFGDFIDQRFTVAGFHRCDDALENIGDAIGGEAIPERRNAPALELPVKHCVDLALEARVVRSDQYICPDAHGHRTLGILPQRQARHAQKSCFLLNAARVGDDQAAPLHQVHEGDVVERLDQAHCRKAGERFVHRPADVRVEMNGKHELDAVIRQLAGQIADRGT